MIYGCQMKPQKTNPNIRIFNHYRKSWDDTQKTKTQLDNPGREWS
jgi:hypothetical protein